MKTIVVAYDDSDAAGRALERAATLAEAFEAKLVVTSVAPVTETTGGRSIGADPMETPESTGPNCTPPASTSRARD